MRITKLHSHRSGLVATALLVPLIAGCTSNQDGDDAATSASSPVASDHDEQLPMSIVRTNAAAFHANFSKGEFSRNGELVTDDIKVNSNTVELEGRDTFVDRIMRYETPFPGMQLPDRVIIVDGRAAAVLYMLQGTQDGPYNGTPPTGRLVEAYSGEIFDFDENGLANGLHTITHLDQIEQQVAGTRTIQEHQQVTLQPNAEVSNAQAELIEQSVTDLYIGLEGSADPAVAAAFADDTVTIVDGPTEQGPEPLIDQWAGWHKALPDLDLRIVRVLQEGDRAAIEYEISGTQDGTFTHSSGKDYPATGKEVTFSGVDFLDFNDNGTVTEVVSVYNPDDVVAQIS